MNDLSYIGCPFCGALLSFEENDSQTYYLLQCTSCNQKFSYISQKSDLSYPKVDVNLTSEPHTASVDAPNVVDSFVNEHVIDDN